jgi:glycosyltransferase involved in cell wall biosynthesis
MKILIATGIYPPDIGGPAQYAVNVEKVWKKEGHQVTVRTYRFERFFPAGIRHILYFIKCIPAAFTADFIFILDTFSAAVPATLLGVLFRKKTIIRTGGDFLWESYVERTGDLVLFRNFYETSIEKFSCKEKLIFRLTQWVLHQVSVVVFSTEWQKSIWMKPYKLVSLKTFVIENYYGPKEEVDPDLRLHTFVASSRDLKWKNIDTLKHVFNKKGSKIPHNIDLLTTTKEFGNFMEIISKCYAVALVSLGDISPNLILDAIRHNRPFICTKEVGIFDRIKDAGIFIDPFSEGEMEEAILSLLDENKYKDAKEKVRNFHFIHTWEDIGREFLELSSKL